MTTTQHALSIALACMLAGASTTVLAAQAAPGGALYPSPSPTATTLDDPVREGGWEGLAQLLDKARPSVNTALQPTPSQVTNRIELLLSQGRYDEAITLIAKRKAELEARAPLGGGTDVQLEFLHARALSETGKTNEALDIYKNMTVLYPELPEPWNNMAALYVSRGELESAEEALQAALRANPNYTTARANLGDVQMMKAQRSYQQAGTGAPKPSSRPAAAPTKAPGTGR
ncbi:tetratricopeptide repeat protein [Alcaligenaceae bacterium C4P045]|nr:tetratricopeptide repeat protein [Alcaligenaceae bacterium C4P045]